MLAGLWFSTEVVFFKTKLVSTNILINVWNLIPVVTDLSNNIP